MGRTIAEAIFEEGYAKGYAEGLAEGRVLFLRRVLLIFLVQRFGSLPEALVQRIDRAEDVERLQAAVRQAKDLRALEDLPL